MNKLLDEKAAALLMDLQPNTLCRWRWENRGPTYHKIGRAVRYHRDDLEAFIAKNRVVAR